MRYDKDPPPGFTVPDFLLPVLASDPEYEGKPRPDPAVRAWELLMQSAANLAAGEFPFSNDWQRASSKPCSLSKAAGAGQEEIRILFGTDRKMKPAGSAGGAVDLASLFGSEAGNRLHLGCAYVVARGSRQDAGKTRDLQELYEVKDHRVFHSTPEGDVGDRLYLTDEIGRPRDETIKEGADKVDRGDDVAGRRGKSRSGNRTAALVFVHGYNVAFSDALLTAAHIASTTDYKGRVYMYSWPSAQSTLRYVQDLDNAEQAEPYLQSFMKLLMRDADIDEIDIVVHSMGSQPVLRALSALRSLFETEREERDRGKRIRIGQIVFAAPDVAVPVFDKKIQRIAPHADRVTVYVSSTDAALFASTFLRGGASRMGEIDNKTKEPAFIDLDNVHLIDATGKESWHGVLWRGYGHDYLTQAKDVLEDIQDILKSQRDQETAQPDQRGVGRFVKKSYGARKEKPFWELTRK
jgi:esterase/lipase superfamily enzyme